ncbi:MAG: PAAR-like domain-containing protein [Mariniblastus sp.]
MPHHVYANDDEIASKSADGKSPVAFPDVCISPGPPPPPSGIPIPYPNTCFAPDLTKVSKTVFIKRKGAALEDHSYFSKSTGDEPATQPLLKGVVSSALTGTCYFTSWSMNVKIEGKGVARHMDLVTHNHSNPANTPAFPYVSATAKANECKKNIKKMEDKCKPEPGKKSMLEKALGPKKFKKLENVLKKVGADVDGWIGDHCTGLMIKPNSLKKDMNPDAKKALEDFMENIETMTQDIDKIIKEKVLEVIGEVKDEIIDKAQDIAGKMVKKKLRNTAIRHTAALGGAAIGGVGAIVTEAGATIWTAGDAIHGVFKAGSTAWDAWGQISDAQTIIDKIPEKLREMAEEAKKNPQKAMANLMSILARINPCTRARRCILPKFKDTELPKALQGDGCCPGQTGHHLLPGEMYRNNPNCPKYTEKMHKNAPVICVEGTSNDFDTGTHGSMHKKLDDKIQDYRKGSWLSGKRETISYEKAREMAIQTVMTTFPESGCNPKCLRAQLDAFYKKMCKKNELKAKSGARESWLQDKIDGSSDKSER